MIYQIRFCVNEILNYDIFRNPGVIVPLHKKGKLDDVNSFRGITQLSNLEKIFYWVRNVRV